jgi:glycosyltransferase involved in cell wall biosynthesis
MSGQLAPGILFIHSGADLYGSSRSLLRLSTRLAKDGFAVHAVLPCHGPLAIALGQAGVNVIVEPGLAAITRIQYHQKSLIALVLQHLRSSWLLYRSIRQIRPALVHTNTSVIPGGGPAARLAGVPHVWHVRESFAEFPRMWRMYRRYMAYFSDSVVCVSQAIADQFPLVERKVQVVHNGIPWDEFEGITTERVRAFRDTYRLEDDSVLAGVVGRIKFRRKGQDFLVEAAAQLRREFPKARFLCIGSPFPGNEHHLEQLLDLINARGLQNEVICTGDVEDIKAAISALDVLVLPTAQPEPFGGVVIEAMALGKPVVATALGGSVEQVVSGETGFLIPPQDADELAAALRKLLVAPALRERMGRAGRKRFLAHFEFEAFYQRILYLYSRTPLLGDLLRKRIAGLTYLM